MKKLTKRIGAIALAASVVMSMALTASAASYKLTLTFTGENAAGVEKTVTATSGSLGENDSLAAAVYQLVASKTTEEQKATHIAHGLGGNCGTGCGLYQLWSSELDEVFDEGKGEYDADAWSAWVSNFEGDYDGNDQLVEWLSDVENTVGDTIAQELGQEFAMTYTTESEKVYVLKVTAKKVNVGGGGAPSAPSTSDEPTTDVVTNPDGSTTTTVTDKSGNKTETIKQTDGVTATTKTDIYGKYDTVVEIPAAAAGSDKTVTLPVAGKTQFTVTTDTAVKVEIPVENVTPGTVVVVVNADGTEEVIKSTTMTENGVAVTLEEGALLKVVDKAKNFTDMDGHWAQNAVSYVNARGLFAGTGNGTTFSPEVKLTRAMMAQVLYNLEGTEDHDYVHGFPDVAAGQWYTDAINWAAKEGVVTGYGDGTYKPEKLLSREEVVQIFFNYAKAKGYDVSATADLSSFVDHHTISDWALAAKTWGVGSGLIGGKGGNLIDPQASTARAECAQMFMNFMEKVTNN